MKKVLLAVALALGVLLGTAAPADAWTWSSATYKAGSSNVGGSSSGGGILRWNGVDYVPGAGHVDHTPGADMWETTSGGYIGHVSHTTNQSRLATPFPADMGLIATGTDPLPPTVRVSNGWTNASIEAYASGAVGQLPTGRPLCQSGFHWATGNNGGYRCGTLGTACDGTKTSCALINANGVCGPGDSGGPVWDYFNGGVILVGWMTNGGGTYLQGNQSYTSCGFTPVWSLARHTWTSAETWTSWGFPTGKTGGCFVTRTGCQVVT